MRVYRCRTPALPMLYLGKLAHAGKEKGERREEETVVVVVVAGERERKRRREIPAGSRP